MLIAPKSIGPGGAAAAPRRTEAWSNQEAFAMLQKMAGSKLDQDCVDALLNRRDEVEKIQAEFQENPFG